MSYLHQAYGQDPRQLQQKIPPGIISGAVQQTGSSYADGSSRQNGLPSQEQGHFPSHAQALGHGHVDSASLNSQMAGMALGGELHSGARSHKKRDRHAHHDLNAPSAPGPPTYSGMPQGGEQYGTGSPASPNTSQGWSLAGFVASQTQRTGHSNTGPQAFSQVPRQTVLEGTPASSAQGRVDPEQIPSVPWARDAPAQYFLDHVYPTMEQHLPPPAAISFVAVDQGNSSPKFSRLTLNNIPASAEALATTALPLGIIIQPLAALHEGEQPIPLIDFGEIGPPRCRRCRAYINPFITFPSGGSKFICNMCNFPNDVSQEYFAPTDPSGVRVDRMQVSCYNVMKQSRDAKLSNVIIEAGVVIGHRRVYRAKRVLGKGAFTPSVAISY